MCFTNGFYLFPQSLGQNSRPLTFLSNGDVFVLAVVVSLPVPQVARVHRDGGFNLQLGRLHAVIEDPEELF